MATILHVDDEPAVALLLQDALDHAGHRPVAARSVPEALQALARGGVDLVISDYRLPGITGIELLGLMQQEGYDAPLIMLTGYASIEHAVAAVRAGAVDYVTKPVRPEQLELAVERALEVVRLRRENAALRGELVAFRSERQIVGESAAVRRLLQTITTAAPTRAAVLLQGESGTGKQLYARAVHDRSDRRDRPFVTLDCAALPEGLVESALFGHERGAFAGAARRTEGALERAHGGTLVLDDVSELRLDVQAKLLRALQDQEFQRVGGTSPIALDVRVVATTSHNLAAEAAAGTFRQDLYYRLSVIPIHVPPLRERADDVPLLAYRFAMQAAAEVGKEVTGIAPAAMELLQRHAWPGNVRELRHAVERAVVLAQGPVLGPEAFGAQAPGAAPADDAGARQRLLEGALASGIGYNGRYPTAGRGPGAAAGAAIVRTSDADITLHTLNVAEAEQVLIQRALVAAGYNRTRAAELLGISVRTLRNKLNGPGRMAAAG